MTINLFANLGRAGSAAPVVESLETIKTFALRIRRGQAVVLGLVEIDEGDQGYDDHHLVLKHFPTPWRWHQFDNREVIGTLGGSPDARSRTVRVPGTAVKHQSPARPIVEHIDGDTVTLVGHPPAGAHNGKRSPKAYALLVAAYARWLHRFRRRIAHHHKLGRNVVYMIDGNWRAFPRLRAREVTAVKHLPDLIRAVPAKGHGVRIGGRGWEQLSVEHLHGLLWARIEFPTKPKP
jgi:hypothetical protein